MNPHFGKLAVLAALCLAGCGQSDKLTKEEDAFAERAIAAVVADAPASPGVKVVSIQVQTVATLSLACGWIDFGGAAGAEPFSVTEFDSNSEKPAMFVTVPHLHDGDYAKQLEGAFDRQFALQGCQYGPKLPPAPANASRPSSTDQTLATLWRSKDAPEWVIVETPGEIGYAAVARGPGRALISPRMGTPAEVQVWIDGPGKAMKAEAK